MIKRLLTAALLALALPQATLAEQATHELPTAGPMSLGTFVSDWLNPALLALQTCNAGNSPPAVAGQPQAFQFWCDADASPRTLSIYDGSQWVTVLTLDVSTHTITLTPQAIELGHPSDTTLTRPSGGNLAVEGALVYRAGGTDVPVADGGTGASTASAARTNLGLAIGSDVQAQDAELAALAGLTSAANRLPYFTGSGTAALTDLTAFARTVLDDADAAAARTTLGVAIGSNVQAYDAELAALAGLTSAANKLPYFTGSGTAAVTDLSGFWRGVLDDADAATSRASLGLAIGTDVQAWDAELAAIAGLTAAADKGIYFTGAGAAATMDVTAYARSVLDDADAATARATLGLGTGDSPQFTGVELGHASDTTLLRSSAGNATIEGNLIYRAGGTDVPVADGGTGASTAPTARTNLGLAIGSDVQAYHARLADLAGLSYAQGDLLYFNGSNLVRLAPGSSGQFLRTQGSAANPEWATIAGGGDMLASNNLSDLANAATARTNLGISAFGASLIDDANAGAARTTLGVTIGSDVQGYNALLAALASGDVWVTKAIGEIVLLPTNLTGVSAPPQSSSLYTYIVLTAGQTGSGQYNNGKLTSESTTGSAPLVSSTAVINVSGSPMNGQTVRLINTEGRFLRPGSTAGTLQDDQMQGHFHSLSRADDTIVSAITQSTNSGSSIARWSTASASGGSVGSISVNAPRDDGVNGEPRTGNETRPKNVSMLAFMRVK